MGNIDKKLLEQLDNSWFYRNACELKSAGTEVFNLFKQISDEDKIFDDLNKSNGLGNSYMLLMACSIENLIKSRVIKQLDAQKKYSNIDEKIKDWNKFVFKNYNILDLAQNNNIKLNANELKLINRYQPFMIWAGRFPFPKSKKDVVDALNHKNPPNFGENDLIIIEILFERMSNEMGIL
jgi:hypothetical protein